MKILVLLTANTSIKNWYDYKILKFDAEYIAADGNIRLTNENKIAVQGRSGNNYYVLCGGEPSKLGNNVWRLNVCQIHISLSFSYQFG